MKICICGSRDFNDYQLFSKEFEAILITHAITDDIIIVSGGARGADYLAKQYAKEHKITYKEFPALWDIHGKSAGYLRNVQMIDYSEKVIAFWDGSSRGTKHSITYASSKGKLLAVYKYNTKTLI